MAISQLIQWNHLKSTVSCWTSFGTRQGFFFLQLFLAFNTCKELRSEYQRLELPGTPKVHQFLKKKLTTEAPEDEASFGEGLFSRANCKFFGRFQQLTWENFQTASFLKVFFGALLGFVGNGSEIRRSPLGMVRKKPCKPWDFNYQPQLVIWTINTIIRLYCLRFPCEIHLK